MLDWCLTLAVFHLYRISCFTKPTYYRIAIAKTCLKKTDLYNDMVYVQKVYM